jgi:superfamily II DNA or RNA helicase
VVEIIYYNHSVSLIKTDFNTLRLIKNHFRVKYNNAFYMIQAVKEKNANSNFDGCAEFVSKTNFIPNGLLGRLFLFLNEKKISFAIKDIYNIRKRKMPDNFDFTLKDPSKAGYITLREYQQKAVIDAFYYTRGILNLATNAGKTEVMASIIKNMQKYYPNSIILVIVPSLQLLDNTRDRLEKELECKLTIYHDKKRVVGKITITTIQTLYSSNKNNIKADFEKVTCFFIDEYHVIGGSTLWYGVMKEVFRNTLYRFGMTGTTKVDDQVKEIMIESLAGSIISKVTNKDLIELGHSVRPTVHFLRMNMPSIPSHRLTYQEEITYTFGYKGFYIHFLMYYYKINTGGNLFLVSNIEHGKMLNHYIKNSYFLSGKDKVEVRNQKLKEWSSGKYTSLIATQIFRYGLDTHAIQKLFIFSIGSKTSKVLQEIGRGLRKNDINKVDIYFMDFKNLHYMNQFAQEQERVVKKEGFEIKKEDI